MKVVIFRSICGFGDRLQMLGRLLYYCKTHNLKICIDWSDFVWGGGILDFHDFFDVVGVETIKKKEVLEYIRKKKNKIQIVPPVWNYESLKNDLNMSQHHEEYDFNIHFKNTDKNELLEGDIFVSNGIVETQYKPIDIVEHIRIKPNVLKIIKTKLKDFDYNNVVHIRGTDKLLTSIDALYDQFKDHPEKLNIITDDILYYNKLKQQLPNIRLLNPEANIIKINEQQKRDNHLIGIHYVLQRDLNQYKVRKYDLIIDLLVDWTAIVFSKKVYGNMNSCFFKTSNLMKTIDVKNVIKMFNGWCPCVYWVVEQEPVIKYYSQINQDKDIIDFYKNKTNGYFVDVGAHDGTWFSNTRMLEESYNWKGVCAEPNPKNYNKLIECRSAYCSSKAVYSTSNDTLSFSVCNGDGNYDMLSGLTDELKGTYKQIVENNSILIKVETITLNDLLDEAKAPTFIEYLSLDTEGSEYEILKAFDFSKYTFGRIDVEHNNIEPIRSHIRTLLESNGYIYLKENQWDDCYVHSSI